MTTDEMHEQIKKMPFYPDFLTRLFNVLKIGEGEIHVDVRNLHTDGAGRKSVEVHVMSHSKSRFSTKLP